MSKLLPIWANVMKRYELSYQQKRLWPLLMNNSAFKAQEAILIDGDVTTSSLRDAVRASVERHEILRATFHQVEGAEAPFQAVSDVIDFDCQEINLSDFDPLEQERRMELLFVEERECPFDLSRGPLLRARLISLKKDRVVLLVTLPALCADAHSLKNLVREATLFLASQNEESAGPALQYWQCSEWQYEILNSEDEAAAKVYWTDTELKAFLAPVLPIENQPSGAGVFRPQALDRTFPTDLTADIGAVARQRNISVSTFLLACWQVLLCRLTGMEDLWMGLACDGRVLDELKDPLGLFAKYLPLRSRLNERAPFDEVLDGAHRSVREALGYQEYYAWGKMAGYEGKPSDGPIFLPFCFTFENETTDSAAGPLRFKTIRHYACFDRFKLNLFCAYRSGSLVVELHYDASLFPPEEIARLFDQYRILVESATRDPEAAIGEMEILSDAERSRLLVEFNRAEAAYSFEEYVHWQFEEQVRIAPDGVCVKYANQQLTYAEVNVRANQVANHLRSLGVGPEALVGICVERSLESLIGILGILKSGGAYLPLDPSQPKERLSFMLKDCEAQVLLTERRLIDRLPGQIARVVCLDDWVLLNKENSAFPAPSGVTPDNLAYAIYTSGSTGRPKAVGVTHRNLAHSTKARFSNYKEKVTGFILVSPISFDSSVAGLFWTLGQGGALLLPAANFQHALSDFFREIDQPCASHLLCLPSLYAVLLDHTDAHQLARLRAVIVAGEPCAEELVARHHRVLPHVPLFNEYGPTENTVWSSVFNCTESAPVAIGAPIPNTQIYLLNSLGRPVPEGAAGEIHIGGAGLSRGYLGRPELTAERFLPNPYSVEPGSRLYKTGDLGRYRSSGDLEFLGRADRQVKISGFRIELGEIEAALSAHASVRECVVAPRDGRAGEKRLVGYVVAREGRTAPEADELRQFLTDSLPKYMIPALFVVMRDLPRTPNGKVDREALPHPEICPEVCPEVGPEIEKDGAAPRTPLERFLASVWEEALGVEGIGVADNFFELGGDSIKGVILINKIRDRLGDQVDVIDLFQSPTIADLAAYLTARHPDVFPSLK